MRKTNRLDGVVQEIVRCQAGFSTVRFSILCGMLAGVLIGLAALVLGV